MKITIEQFREAMISERDGWASSGSSIELENSRALVLDIDSLKIHKLALTNPPAGKSDFDSLRDSLATNGQLEPVIVFRNKIIDGRNRYNALHDLGVKYILAEKLPHTTSIKDLEGIVKMKETRRHQTVAQKAIKAYRVMQEDGLRTRDAAIECGVSEAEVSRVNRIANKLGTDILNELFSKGRCKLPNGRSTGTLSTIISFIRDLEKIRDNNPNEVKTEDGKKALIVFDRLCVEGNFEELARLKVALNKKLSEG
jgi:hypothetical protein